MEVVVVATASMAVMAETVVAVASLVGLWAGSVGAVVVDAYLLLISSNMYSMH